MNTDMVLDALEQALHDRGMPKNVIHHPDRGVQYLSIRYTNRLEAANLRASVGTTGDSYDNALAYRDWETDRKSTRLNSSHSGESRMPSSA